MSVFASLSATTPAETTPASTTPAAVPAAATAPSPLRRLVTLTLSLCLLLGALITASLPACADAEATPQATLSLQTFTSDASGLQTFTSDASGFDTHSFYLDTGREVVVFDAQFTEPLAEALLKDIQAHTTSPIRYVVITHPNPDKMNGVGVFQRQGAKVIASDATAAAIPGVHAYKKYYFVQLAKMFTDATYPPQAKPDITFQGEHRLALEGGAEVTLKTLTHPGVSSTQTVAHIPALGALVVGDLIHHRAHAWLEGGIVDGQPHPDLTAWRAALDELTAAYPASTTVYGGRGERAPLSEAVAAQRAYLTKLNDLVLAHIKGLDAPTLDALRSDAATQQAHSAQLTAAAAAAFPDYALPYMITYGVYGLVQHHLAAL
jgi:glyoxylase-like metal-dependent hydrolase (beta-lactamase superfamily II)